MLPRQHRLTRDRDIRRVVQSHRKGRGRFLLIRANRRGPGPARLTVVVSTKVSKKATVRNRLKRQVRGLLARRLQAIPAGRDYLVTILPGGAPPSGADLQDDLDLLFPSPHPT